jgi:hypothetical protein
LQAVKTIHIMGVNCVVGDQSGLLVSSKTIAVEEATDNADNAVSKFHFGHINKGGTVG